MASKTSLFQKLGPGLLYAGAAIGVSHLVQSTRAGASFGISMIAVVILTNFLKYPFFQYGPRYVAATGKSLLHGYRKLGSWAIWVFFLLTLGTMFIIQGAVTMVTAGLASYLVGGMLPLMTWIIIILILSMILLISGTMKLIDKFIKLVMVILSITTIAAAISSFFAHVEIQSQSEVFSFLNREHIFFLIAFIGWMPAPIDISVWYSVWSETKAKESGEKTSLSASLFDFSIGYWGTAILAICFVLLGALMLHNTGIKLSSNAVEFSGQIIAAYTQSLGTWATPVIAISAFTTMLSTTIAVMDGITRVLVPTTSFLFLQKTTQKSDLNQYKIWLFVLISGTLILIWKFSQNMKQMVDFATSLSFLTAPILAYLNIRVMHSKEIALAYAPSLFTKRLSYFSLTLLTGFSIIYIYYKFVI